MLRRLYLEAEVDDGYVRDQDVFGEGVSGGKDEIGTRVHGGAGLRQRNALCRQFLFDRTRHVSSPFV